MIIRKTVALALIFRESLTGFNLINSTAALLIRSFVWPCQKAMPSGSKDALAFSSIMARESSQDLRKFIPAKNAGI